MYKIIQDRINPEAYALAVAKDRADIAEAMKRCKVCDKDNPSPSLHLAKHEAKNEI